MRDDDVVETTAVPVVSGMADLSGSVLDNRYRLETPLGQGSMANVYRAVDERLNRKVAVKLFHSGQDGAGRARFAAEAHALARLSHSGLIGIFDVGTSWERPYLVMQLVDGESLRDRLLNGPLTPDEVVQLGTRLSLALAHVHHNGIVHRDIKPSNIVLDSQGLPHLADFGIALLLDAARMTSSNEIMGTAAYLSPEQITGAQVGAAADIYSLGLVLLECLTGELEYPGGSKVESALARLHRNPRVPAGIPPVLARLLAAMTAREAADRPAARECAAWFVAVREHSGASRRILKFGAADWLARKGSELGRSRTRAPLFSGWRRFTIAGSGLAMAIFASAWLFTSLLPKVMPVLPEFGSGDAQPHAAAPSGTAASRIQLDPTRTGMRVAVSMPGARSPSSGAPTTATPTSGAQPTSTSGQQVALGGAANAPGTTTTTDPGQFSIQQGPASGSSSTTPSPSPTPSSTTTTDAPSNGPASTTASATASTTASTTASMTGTAAPTSAPAAPSGNGRQAYVTVASAPRNVPAVPSTQVDQNAQGNRN